MSWIWNKKKSWSQNDWEIKEKDDDILLRDTKVFQFNNLIMANESFWREANQMDWQIYLLFNICIYMQLGLVLFFAIFRSFFFHQFEFFSFLDEIRNCFSKRNTKRKHYNNEATTKIVPRFLDDKQGEMLHFMRNTNLWLCISHNTNGHLLVFNLN